MFKPRNIIIGGVLAFAILSVSSNVNAISTLVSKGRLANDNGTIDNTNDDIILYDATDLYSIEDRINNVYAKIVEIRKNL